MTARMTPQYRGGWLAFGPLIVAAALLAPAATAWADPSAEAVEAIEADYAEFGGANSLLGTPVSDAVDVPGGAMRDYQGGAIYYSKDTGAHVISGAILDRYRELGGPDGTLGYPTNDESDTGDGVGRFNDFAAPGGASIFWTPESGAWIVTGRVLEAWRSSGGITGPFGYPTADTSVTDGVQAGLFAGPEGTEIQWSTADGLVTVPAELAATIPGPAPAEPPPPPSSTSAAPTTPAPPASEKSTKGSTWWWIPVGIIAALVVLGLLRLLLRRRPAAPTEKPGPAAAPAPPLPDSAMSEPTTVIATPELRKPPPREVPTSAPPRATPQYVAPRTSASPSLLASPVPPLPTPPRVPPAAPPRVAPPLAAEPKPASTPPAPRTPPPAVPSAPAAPPRPSLPMVPPAPPVVPPAPPVRPMAPDQPKAAADASPVIRYETQPPAESAIQVTYENNALGDNQESAADKSNT